LRKTIKSKCHAFLQQDTNKIRIRDWCWINRDDTLPKHGGNQDAPGTIHVSRGWLSAIV
jgi:hypothetical protein